MVAKGRTGGLLYKLISYWKLDEASGTRADSHFTNTLSDNNTVTSATGKINDGALFVAANSEFLSHASNSSLQMSGNPSFTITAWIKLSSLPSAGAGFSLVTKDDDAANSRDYTFDYVSGVSPSGFRFYIHQGPVTVNVTSTDVVANTAQWYFIVSWYDSSNGQTHLRIDDTTTYNGLGALASGVDVSAAEFRVGAREYAGFPDYSDAVIDEVGLWKRLLTSAEITQLYNSGAGLPYSSF